MVQPPSIQPNQEKKAISRHFLDRIAYLSDGHLSEALIITSRNYIRIKEYEPCPSDGTGIAK